MRGNHAVRSHGDHLTITLDLVHHNAQPVQLGDIFIPDEVLLPADAHNLTGVARHLEKNLLVLPREILIHLAHSRRVFVPGTGQLGELEILRTLSFHAYLQKYFLAGKSAAPLKLTPCKM
jgi:hypothetical protein